MLTIYATGVNASATQISAPWQQPGQGAGLLIFAAMCTVGGVARPAQAAWCLGAFLVGTVMAVTRHFMTRIVITEDVVRYDQGPLVPKPEVARQDVRAVRRHPWTVAFCGPDGRHILTIGGHWTVNQLTEIAGMLEVPLFDHRIWYGLRSVKKGRLIASADGQAGT
jgi:hypothetical protein